MIQWEKYFDKIICINYTEYTRRKELMQSQLKRIGILDSPIFEWEFTYRGPYEAMLKKLVDPTGKLFSDGTFSCIMGHINAIKKAYFTGCKNVLIIEDDARFLRDLDLIDEIIRNKPKEEQYDVVIFDKFVTDRTGGKRGCNDFKSNKDNYYNDYYLKMTIPLLSASCYCLSRNGMKLILDEVDKGNITTLDYYFCVKFLKDKLIKFCSVKNVAIQSTFMNAQNFARSCDYAPPNTKAYHLQYVYKNQDLNFDEYMIREDGSKFNYGDYLE